MAKNRKHVTLGDISSMLNKHFIKYVKSEKSIKALKNVKADDLIILNNRSDFRMYSIVASGGSGSIPTANGMYANPIDISGTADINSAINARVKYSDISQTMNTGADKVPSMALISNNDQLYARVSQIVNDFVTGGANTLASGNTVKLLYQLIQNMGEGGAVKLEYYLQRASQSRLTSIGTLAKGTTTIVPSQGIIISPMVFLNDELLVPTTDYTIDAATTSITLTRARNYDGVYFIIDDYMPKYKFSVQSVDYLLGSNLLKAKLMIDDVIDIQGDVESYDGGHHMRIVQATSGLNGVLVKDGMYLNEIPNTRPEEIQAFIPHITTEDNSKLYIFRDADSSIKFTTNVFIKHGRNRGVITKDTKITSTNLGSAFVVGTDYYIYATVDTLQRVTLTISSTKDISKLLVGGFHYGNNRRHIDKVPVNTSNAKWGAGWEDNIYDGILEFSVYTPLFRPTCSPEGMVCINGDLWVDIYISSNTNNGGFISKYNEFPAVSISGHDFTTRMGINGKRLLSYSEFRLMGTGSPLGRDDNNEYAWSMTTNTSRQRTGFVKKAVSVYGTMDVSGNVWEWLSDIVCRPVDSPVGWGWKNLTENKYGGVYSYHTNGLSQLLGGGSYNDGRHCGPGAVLLNIMPWIAYSDIGSRGGAKTM